MLRMGGDPERANLANQAMIYAELRAGVVHLRNALGLVRSDTPEIDSQAFLARIHELEDIEAVIWQGLVEKCVP